MITQLRSARFQLIGRMPTETEIDGQAPEARGLGRLIPIALALYLTPVLLIVLLVGGVGMLVLALVRAFTALAKASSRWPHTSGQTRGPLA
jgi:hypothetical protein